MQTFQTVGGYVDDVTGFAQPLLEELGRLDFVFDNQDLHMSPRLKRSELQPEQAIGYFRQKEKDLLFAIRRARGSSASVAPCSMSDHVSFEGRMRPSSCSSIEKTRLWPLPDDGCVELVSIGSGRDGDILPSVVYFCTACRKFESRAIEVSTVNAGSVMLNSQRDVAIAFRLAAIVVLLPQAREIRRSLRPSHGEPSPGAGGCPDDRACGDNIKSLLFVIRGLRSIRKAATVAFSQICC